jgi:hypothetical protein
MTPDFIEKINSLEVDASPIFDDEQDLKIWTDVEDASGQDVRVRIDLRWVSIDRAILALQETFLVDLIHDRCEDGSSDILVTQDSHGTTCFCVLDRGSQEFTISAGERFRA